MSSGFQNEHGVEKNLLVPFSTPSEVQPKQKKERKLKLSPSWVIFFNSVNLNLKPTFVCLFPEAFLSGINILPDYVSIAIGVVNQAEPPIGKYIRKSNGKVISLVYIL